MDSALNNGEMVISFLIVIYYYFIYTWFTLDLYVHVWGVCPLTKLSPAAAHHLLSGPDAAQYGLFQLGLHVFGLFKGQAVHSLERLLPLHGEHNMGLVSIRWRVSERTEKCRESEEVIGSTALSKQSRLEAPEQMCKNYKAITKGLAKQKELAITIK